MMEILSQASYIFSLRKHMKSLKCQLKKLEEESVDVRLVVDACLRNGMVVMEEVTEWLDKAKNLIIQVNQVLEESEELEKKRYLLSCCPPKIWQPSYTIGKKIAKMIKEVQMLCSETFDTFSCPAPQHVQDFTDPTELTESQKSALTKVWECLHNDAADPTDVIAIVGVGGIGKTTILRKIHEKQALHDKKSPETSPVVIFSRVSQVPNVNKIQGDIRKALGILEHLWENKSPNERTKDLNRILSRKKFVLLLDDIWKGFNFENVGIPVPEKNHNRSKVIFTTRSRDVCTAMNIDHLEIFPVKALPEEEAWSLFTKAVGDTTLNSLELARNIVRNCQGLPLAIVAVGRALAKEGMDASKWADVLNELQIRSDDKPNPVFSTLMMSYDLLNDDVVKACFRFCSLLPVADRDQLIDYWIGEGLILEKSDFAGIFDDARYRGHIIIEGLIKNCLLMAEGTNSVRMHDITREVALAIADREGENLMVRAGAYLTEAPEIAEWREAYRISLTDNGIRELPKAPYCDKLSTLILSKSGLKCIPDDFFEFMPSLKVLDLSSCEIGEIPKTIISLLRLEYLNLSNTNITTLPTEFKNLLNLKVLDLSHIGELNAIPKGIITALTRLLVLNVYFCGCHEWIVEGEDLLVGGKEFIIEVESLQKVNHLGISIRDVDALERLQYARKLQLSANSLLIKRCKGMIELVVSSFQFMLSLRKLEIRECADLEKIQITDHDHRAEAHLSSTSLKDVRFYNLQHVQIEGCWSLVDLSWLTFVPNLEMLHVHKCMNLKSIIGEHGHLEKHEQASSSSFSPSPRFYIFSRLRYICLSNLPSLSSISPPGVSFSILEEIRVSYCPNLKELPFGLTSSIPNSFKSIKGQLNWWNRLKWEEGGNIKNDLVAHFQDIPY